VLVRLVDCDDEVENVAFLKYNYTSGEWECTDPIDFGGGGIFNNQENLFPHLCVGTASDPINPFSNYKLRAIEFDKPKDCNWVVVAPQERPETAQIEIYWYVDKVDAGTVCFQSSVLPLDEGEDIDGVFVVEKEVCRTFVNQPDELQVSFLNYTMSDITSFDAGDLVIIKIGRNDNGTNTDDYNDPAWAFLARLTWDS